MSHTLVPICILDTDKERCLREERALEQAIALEKVNATAFCHYGECNAARHGLEKEQLPVLEIGDAFFMPNVPNQELNLEALRIFLRLLVGKGLLHSV